MEWKKILYVLVIILMAGAIIGIASAADTKRDIYDYQGSNQRTKVNYSLFNSENFTGIRANFSNITILDRIIQNGYYITFKESNSFINGNIFTINSNATTVNDIPFVGFQPGGAGQASWIAGSLMLVDRNASVLDITNASSCTSWFDSEGITQQIDCNSTSPTNPLGSGPDFVVFGDSQIAGESWLRNSEGEWRFFTRILTLLDETYENILFNDANLSIVNGDLTINDTLNETLVVNLNRSETIFTNTSDSITLNTGTNITPAVNHISYQDPLNPSLVIGTSDPTVPHADVAVIYAGADISNIYLFNNEISHNEKFIDGVYDRFGEEGAIYISGLTPTATVTQLSISTGVVRLKLTKEEYSNSIISDTDGFFYINSTGNFVQCPDNSCLTKYADDTNIGNNKYYTTVWGVVPISSTEQRLMVLVQGNPGSGREYNTPLSAEEDPLSQASFFPSNTDFKSAFIPVVRTIHRRTGNNDFVSFPTTGELFQDLRGKATVGSGGVPSPPITDHNILNNLDFASANHTGFIGDVDFQGAFDSNKTNIFDQVLNTTSNVNFTGLIVSGDGNFTADLFVEDDLFVTDQVGIGTLNPSHKLNLVEGRFNISSSFNDKIILEGSQSDPHTILLSGNQGMRIFDDDNGEIIFFNETGLVGIGTPSPNSILHIKANTPGTVGSHAAGQLIIQDPDDTVFGNAVITGYESDGSGNPDQQLWYLGSSSSSNSNIIFLNRRNALLQFGTSDTSRLTILGNGNVGIGTTAPTHKLNVNGNFNVTGGINLSSYLSCTALETDANGNLLCGSDSGGATSWLFASNLIYNDTSTVMVGIANVTPVIYGLQVDNNVSLNKTLFVNTNGLVGIGTDSPDKELDVPGEVIIGIPSATQITKDIPLTIAQDTVLGDTQGDENLIAYLTGMSGTQQSGLRITQLRTVTPTDNVNTNLTSNAIRFAWAMTPGSANVNDGRAWFDFGSYHVSSFSEQAFRWGINSQTGDNDASATEWMRLNSAGLGIGVDPSATLDVVGTSEFNGNMLLTINSDLTINDGLLTVGNLVGHTCTTATGDGDVCIENNLEVDGILDLDASSDVQFVSTANTACSTQCGSNACLSAFALGIPGAILSNFVSCADATADQCFCSN